MRELTNEVKDEIKEVVYEFFADECEIKVSELKDESRIAEDLDGDSLLFIELVELLKRKYDLAIQLQTVGKYLLRNQVKTLGELVEIAYLIYQKENEIL